MKQSLRSLTAAVAALLTAAFIVVTMDAQAPAGLAPQGLQSTAGNPPPSPPRTYPSPTNLKVLPKDLTGQQVHNIMVEWEGSLGVQCDSCHAKDPDDIGQDGHPKLDFADDSKPMKSVARTMYTMTEEINDKYVAKIEGSGVPVTCGTCHRGRMGPEPFVIPNKDTPPAPQSAQPAEEQPLSQ